MAAAAALADVDTVLTICGFDAQQRNILTNVEGFINFDTFGILDGDRDVNDIFKRAASRTVAQGRMVAGTIQIKRFQSLVWWINDHRKRNLAIVAADWTPAAMAQAATDKRVAEEEKETVTPLSVKELPKFHDDDYDVCEEQFLNLLSTHRGVTGESLRYLARDAVVPTNFVDTAEERMYQMPLAGTLFQKDNKAMYKLLKAYVGGTAGDNWIKDYAGMEDGRQAW